MYLMRMAHCLMSMGAARRAANEPEMVAIYGCWQSIASGWRERQLRYSWLYSMMGRYEDFWILTQRALDDTLRDHNLSENQSIRARLLELYRELPPYDEARKVLKKASRVRSSDCCIF